LMPNIPTFRPQKECLRQASNISRNTESLSLPKQSTEKNIGQGGPIFQARSFGSRSSPSPGGAADLGYTTGIWELKKGDEPRSLGFGHYVTIWAKQRNGQWKIALDVGTENPQPPEPPPSLQLLPPDVTAGTPPQENSRRTLQKAERQFAEAAHDDIGKAILDCATDDIRVYREKSFPAVGLVAARLMLTPERGKVRFEAGGSKMSRSGDLSYSYGKYSEERGNAVEHGIYLTIWRANMNGDWKLALNLQKKLPPKS
jgi:ketosteroid isomerase-like protein